MRVNRGAVAGLAVVVLWASAFPAIEVAAPALGVIGLSMVRLGVASVILLVIAVTRRIRMPAARDLGWIFAAGFFGMTAYQVLLNQSELTVPAGTASIIVAAAPLVSVAVARILFAVPISRATIVGSVIALSGVAVVCLTRAGASLSASVWITVAAMAVQGIYHPLQRPLLSIYTGLEVASYTMLAGTVMTLPTMWFEGGHLATAPISGWIAAFYLGALPSALGFVLWGYAVGHLPIAASTSLLYLVPPVAVLIAWVWFDDVPLPAELIGGSIVIAGVIVTNQGTRILQRLRQSPQSPSIGDIKA